MMLGDLQQEQGMISEQLRQYSQYQRNMLGGLQRQSSTNIFPYGLQNMNVMDNRNLGKAFYGDNVGQTQKIFSSIRDELQHETDEWLKDVNI